jgi:clan AA aspartic protease
MGPVRARIQLTNLKRVDLSPVEVDALVDTGALHLCVPEHIALQLELEEFDRRELTFADGSKRLASYVGPLTVAVANRRGLAGAMVIGDEVLLGAIPMEDMDLVVRPLSQEVGPNPLSPNIPASIAVGVRPS